MKAWRPFGILYSEVDKNIYSVNNDDTLSVQFNLSQNMHHILHNNKNINNNKKSNQLWQK